MKMLKNNVIALSEVGQSISVVNVRRSPKDGPTRAYVDLQYYGATIKGLSVVRNKNGGHFVGFPVRFGNNKAFSIVEFAEPERTEISKLVLQSAMDYLD